MTSNVAASVRARLSNLAKANGRPSQELLQHFGLERFLYRLCCSQYATEFVLKGGLMLRVQGVPIARPTRDIDLLGFLANDLGKLEEMARALCAVQVQDDGMRFDGHSVAATRIKEGEDYEGVRITLRGFLGRAQIPVQIDVGFGDRVHPETKIADYPVLLEFPRPRLRVYPRETVVAEKFEAMVKLGTVNSRMKDFYDIWMLARAFPFSGAELGRAISGTFDQRGTALSRNPVGLSQAFGASDRAREQWRAFRLRSHLVEAPVDFAEVLAELRGFLVPVVEVLLEGGPVEKDWAAGGAWE